MGRGSRPNKKSGARRAVMTGASWATESRVTRMPRPADVSNIQRSGGSGFWATAATAVRPSGVRAKLKMSPPGPTAASSRPARSSQTSRLAACGGETTSRFSETEKKGEPGATSPSTFEIRAVGSPWIARDFGSQAAAMRFVARTKSKKPGGA